MEVQFGPNSVDEPGLLYKLQRKIKVFNTSDPLSNRGYNLVASSSKYCIVFVGSPDGNLLVYQLKDLIDKECDVKHLSVKLPDTPTFIAVSCDQELLATAGAQLLCVYKVSNFNTVNVSPSVTIELDVHPSTFLCALQWNPCIPDNIALAFFDGTLLVSSVANPQVKKVQAKARCICWSPKGKQLVTGNSDGSLCQFKPDLTLAKTILAPNLFGGAPVESLAIYWISTYQFAVVFRNAADNSRPVVTIVNTPKAGQPTCLNYEDICYSMGSNRPWYYYLLGIAQWNIILASSSNSMEIATLGSSDGANWAQWCQSDEARPELPLTDKKIENYPIGICIDTCAIHQLPWGENEVLPPMPLLHVLSQCGLLTVFNIVSSAPGASQVCTPQQQLTPLTLPPHALTSDVPGEAPAQVTLPAPPSVAVLPKPQPQPVVPQPVVPQPVVPQPVVPQPVVPQPVVPQPVMPQPVQATLPARQTASIFGQPFASPAQPQVSQAFSTAAIPAAEPPKPKQPEPKPAPPQPQPQPVVAKSQPSQASKQASEVNAALKAEQEKMTRLKADQELRSMLVKEVNDFQMELYKFFTRTREVQNKLRQDLASIDARVELCALDGARLRRECALDELRDAIVQLKLELVRACAVVADARTHAEAKDDQWNVVDPLTSKRVSSVKQLAYYVQSELEKAHRALDHRWGEALTRDTQRRGEPRMIRPILDDVYQPLVRQQEILSQQQAVLRQLRNTLKEVDAPPFNTSLLKHSVRSNKDPLSKLTKNILNMSIEPETTKSKDSLLTPQKLDALRDMLSNHKPTKIKPVNVELRQHLAQRRLSYEKSVKQREEKQVKPEPVVAPQPTLKFEMPVKTAVQPVQATKSAAPTVAFAQPSSVPKPTPLSVPSFTPTNQSAKPGLNNVVRTLFTADKTTPESQPQPQSQLQPQSKPLSAPQVGLTPSFTFVPPSMTASANTRSILKDMLQNKQANSEAKNDANTFMGQKICSPTSFTFTPTQPDTNVPSVLTSKPIADLNNMFNKFTPGAFTLEAKAPPKPKTVETAESEPKPVEIKKEEKPQPLFPIKVPTVPPSAASMPDVAVVKIDNKIKVEKEKVKENIPDKFSENIAPVSKDAESEKKEVPKFSFGSTKPAAPLFGMATSTPILSQTSKPPEKKVEEKPITKPEVKLGTQTEVKPVIQPEMKSVSQPEVNLVTQPEMKPVTQPEAKPTTQPEVKLATQPEVKPDTKPVIKLDLKPAVAKESPKVEATSPTSNASSIFAAANAATPPSPKPGTPTSTMPSMFGSSASPVAEPKITKETPTATSASSIFASAVSSQPLTTTTQSGSIFSSPPTSSVFGSTQGSIFGAAATITTTQSSPSIFGTSVVQSTAQPIFGSSESKPSAFSTPATPAAVFAAAASETPPTTPTKSTAQPAFGGGSIFATTSQSAVFGTVFGTATSTASLFAPTTTTPSVFGAATTTTQSVFGSTSSSGVFGAAATPTFGTPATAAQSIFGTATATTQASIFGSPTSTQSSIFGTTTPTTQVSVFGATTQASVFGSPAQPAQASVFGAPATTQTSVFGSPTPTTQASVFGSPPTTTAGGSIFGGADNLFAAASISTTNAGSASGGSIFGGGSSGSVFGSGGSGTNVFGKTTFSQSNPQAAAIFGGGASFGQKPAANFWSGGSTTGSSGFGSSSFGQQATTQASSIFGGSTGGSFSSPSTAPAFGSPQQTSVFGSAQQAAPAFGGSPVFGAKPAFGQSAAFGTPPASGGFGSFGGFNKSPNSGFGAPAAFGGPPAFGGSAFGSTSPGKAFGNAPAPSFAAPTQSNATFEQLATQNTLTFGNLAQQSSPQAQPAPSFNASPSFTGWRG